MNKILKIFLIVLGVLVALGVLAVAGFALWSWRTGVQYGYAGVPPMMRGYGRANPQPGYGYGYGPMMGRRYPLGQNLQPLTVDEAKQAAQAYLNSLNLGNLTVGEVMVFSNNAYVEVKETDTGLGAFELIVDPASKTAYPEPGANVMWNLKYGALNGFHMMGGRGMGWMMYGYGQGGASPTPANVTAAMPITQDQAVKLAQAYLDQYLPGNTAANDPVEFYGYYTLDYSKDGKVAGMLSVNGYNGLVILHTWHGTFVQESQ